VEFSSVIANAPGDSSPSEIPGETITLLNRTAEAIELVGLTICDENASWTIPAGSSATTIMPGQQWSVTGSIYNPASDCSSGICLRNSGETLVLSCMGVPIDAISYPSCSGSTNDGKLLQRDRFVELPASAAAGCGANPCVSVQDVASSPMFSITAWGAAGEVAGSCYLVRLGNESILIDCGSFMGAEGEAAVESTHADEDSTFMFDPREIDAVLITHAHDDHTGRLHYLLSAGFSGFIYMTDATAEIAIAKLTSTIEWWECASASTKASTLAQLLRAVSRVNYGQPVQIADGLTANFTDAGHIPGSASIVLTYADTASSYTLVFSGDLGSGWHPFLDGPTLLSEVQADILVIESTYGDEVRDAGASSSERFLQAVAASKECSRLVVVPTFALDRMQSVLAALREGISSGVLRVAVGGLSSCQLTEIYRDFQLDPSRYGAYFSDAFWSTSPLEPAYWEYVRGPDCSCSQCEKAQPALLADLKSRYDVIVTPSGFGSSSLSEVLLDAAVSDDSVMFIKVGWSPDDEPIGRLAASARAGASMVQLTERGSILPLRCSFVDISDFFSGHADQNGLAAYARALKGAGTILIGHGDPEAASGLQKRLTAELPDSDVTWLQYGAAVQFGE
jgi:metallo-beta-lactamase family protein